MYSVVYIIWILVQQKRWILYLLYRNNSSDTELLGILHCTTNIPFWSPWSVVFSLTRASSQRHAYYIYNYFSACIPMLIRTLQRRKQ